MKGTISLRRSLLGDYYTAASFYGGCQVGNRGYRVIAEEFFKERHN